MMDYLDTLPGATVYRVAIETRAAFELSNREAVQSTMLRHRDALERLRDL